MNIIQRTLVKLLSAKTKEELARDEIFEDREGYGMAIKALTKVTTALPSSTDMADRVQSIVSLAHEGKVNHLVADKIARAKLGEAFGVIDKDELNALLAIGKVLRNVE